MENIKPFIDLGWHTVPLRGKLERLEDGGKTIPLFEDEWRQKYHKERNTIASKLGGTLTGEVSGIIAIDCDNTATFALFRALDPDYQFVFMSVGKGDKVCGTFIYAYDEQLTDSFGVKDDLMELDFYSTNGFVYLPTDANKTKLALAELPELKAAPPTVKTLLQQLKRAKDGQLSNRPPEVRNIMTAHCLAPLVKQFNAGGGAIMPGLFRIITPRDFRDLGPYLSSGYLHPKDVPTGRGSEYLMKVSAILGADISIDAETYAVAMHHINNLFDDSMTKSRLDSTILDPMTEGKSSIDGKAIWQYDPEWEKYKLVLATKRHTHLDIVYDDKRDSYYVVDEANQFYKSFDRETALISYVAATAINAPKKVDMLRSMPLVNVESNPGKPFGFSSGEDPAARYLNTFVPTPGLAILANPEIHAANYRKPVTILNFFKTLVPDDEMRNYLLQFTRHKLTTFKYSPVILYFLGVHGSGKDTYVSILEQIIGHVARPTTKEFLEMFNGWLLDSYIVQLDEYGNQLTNIRDKDEALGKLKAYTGKPKVQIRQMRTDGFTHTHSATFIMTANKNPLMMEDGDRRVALFQTPNKLKDADWVRERGGTERVIYAIEEEILDFCYYLATEVPRMLAEDYTNPPDSEAKHAFIADSMYAAQRIGYAMKHNMRDYLVNLANDFGCGDCARAFESGRVPNDPLETLYMEMTDQNGDMRSLNKVIKGFGIEQMATTVNGQKAYVYKLNWEQAAEDDNKPLPGPVELSL